MGKGSQPVVQCVYSEAGGTLPELLAETFRLFLRRSLEEAASEETGIRL